MKKTVLENIQLDENEEVVVAVIKETEAKFFRVGEEVDQFMIDIVKGLVEFTDENNQPILHFI